MTTPTKPTTGGMRFDSGKLRFNLIPMDAKVELARVYTIGAIKYDDDNWLKGMSWKIMIDCAERHFALFQMGQTRDPDTGCHHLAQAAWNLIGLLVYDLRGLGTDDRTKLPIDENFNWIAGRAKELGLGLSKEETDALRAKYTKMREEHKARLELAAEIGKTLETVKAQVAVAHTPKEEQTAYARVAMRGRLDQDCTPGYAPVLVFCDSDSGERFPLEDGDDVVVTSTVSATTLFNAVIGPNLKIPADLFQKRCKAKVMRTTELFSQWHIRVSVLADISEYTKAEFDKAFLDYTTKYLERMKMAGVPIDMAKITASLEKAASQDWAKESSYGNEP